MCANINNVFTDKETSNWFKASIALIITKQGLEKFVDKQIQKVHTAVGASCGQCKTENLLPCPRGKCQETKPCNFHKLPALIHRPCPVGVCDKVKLKIESYHRYTQPSWKNTRASLWATNHWEVAKCFLPPDGYTDVSSVQDTDFNGVISVLLNCKHFNTLFSFPIAALPQCILTQARKIGKEVRHTTSCQVTDSELHDYIQTLTSLLSDPKYLAVDPDATTARNKLKDIENNQPFITPEQLIEHLKDAQRALLKLQRSEKTLTQKQQELSEKIEKSLEDINAHIKTCLQSLDQNAKQAAERVLQEGQNALQMIETSKQASIQNIDEKGKEAEKRVLQKSEKKLQELKTTKQACLQHIDEKTKEAAKRVSQEGAKTRQEIETTKQVSLQNIDEKGKEAEKRVSQEGVKTSQEIETLKLASLQNIDEKGKEAEQRISREGERAVETIESHKKETIQILDDKYKEIKKERNNINDRKIEDFRQKLIQHYTIKLKNMPLSRLNPSSDSTTLEEMYAIPLVYRTDTNKSWSRGPYEKEGRTKIHSYKDMFGKTCKSNLRIFLQGEAGSGKTTFVAKLVLDWCKAFQSTRKTVGAQSDWDDLETLKMFPFVFLVTLRDSIGEREIHKMIKQQITDIIFSDFKREKAYVFVQQIMEKEICLVVQDGLDEWYDKQNKLGQPLMVSSHAHCYVLTTTRPWKMADKSINNSDVSDLFTLEGLQDPYELCAKVIGKYKDGDKIYHLVQFANYLRSSNVNNEMILMPMLLNIMVLAWIEDNPLKGSACEIYSVMLDTLLKKTGTIETGYIQPPVKCFAQTRYLRSNIENINALSLLAFRTLFSMRKELSIVFLDTDMKENEISKSIKEFALQCGILIERKCPTLMYASSTFSFVHKSVHEFLAAYFVAVHEHTIDFYIPSLIKTGVCGTNEMMNLFKFLCGLNIQAANKLSCLLFERQASWPRLKFQQSIIDGCREAQASQVDDNMINFKLSRIYWNHFNTVNRVPFNFVVKANLSNIRSLTIIDSVVSNAEICLQSQFMQDVLTETAHCLRFFELHFWSLGIPNDDSYKSATKLRNFNTFKNLVIIRLYCIYSVKEFCPFDDRPDDLDRIFQESNSHVTGFQNIILPCTIEEITLQNVTLSSSRLRHMLLQLATFDHAVTCRLRGCHITCPKDKTAISVLKSDSCDRNSLTFLCSSDCEGLYEALTGLKINTLELFCISMYDLCFETLQTIAELETLKIAFFTFVNDISPSNLDFDACNNKKIEFIVLSPEILRNLLEQLSQCDPKLKCMLDCGYDKNRLTEYKGIKQHLKSLQFPGLILKPVSFSKYGNYVDYDDYDDNEYPLDYKTLQYHKAKNMRIEFQCKQKLNESRKHKIAALFFRLIDGVKFALLIYLVICYWLVF